MHYMNPDKKAAHVLIVYRDVQKMGPYSHKALGVNAMHTAKVLRKNGIRADVIGAWPANTIAGEVSKYPSATHVVIEAPWVFPQTMWELIRRFPNIHWLVRTHSQIGFLQVEPGAVDNLRELIHMQDGELNLSVAANSSRLAYFVENVYQGRCVHLPNLYDMERVTAKTSEAHDHRKLVIGAFGALRLLKNHSTSASAAMLIARRCRKDLEFWINVGREETSGGRDVLPTLRHMFKGIPWAKLVESPWQPWAEFRRTIAHMDLLMQPSFTETFNITAADAVAEGVPVVAGDAIEWLPDSWKASCDDAEDVARVGRGLLADPGAPADGLKALTSYVRAGVKQWMDYLSSNPT